MAAVSAWLASDSLPARPTRSRRSTPATSCDPAGNGASGKSWAKAAGTVDRSLKRRMVGPVATRSRGGYTSGVPVELTHAPRERSEETTATPAPRIRVTSTTPGLVLVQARMEVGTVDDPAEREADRMADLVVRSLATIDASAGDGVHAGSTRIHRRWSAEGLDSTSMRTPKRRVTIRSRSFRRLGSGVRCGRSVRSPIVAAPVVRNAMPTAITRLPLPAPRPDLPVGS